MIDVKKLDLKRGDILAITFEDDLDGDAFARIHAQIAPLCTEHGVAAVFLERATPVIVRADDSIATVDRAGLLEALRVLLDVESIGDRVYDVREKAAGDGTFTGNTWDHPRVQAFSAAVQKLEALRAALTPPEPEEL